MIMAMAMAAEAASSGTSGITIVALIVIPVVIALFGGGAFVIRAVINFTKDNTKSQTSLSSIDANLKGLREDHQQYMQKNDQDITVMKGDIKVLDSRVYRLEWQGGSGRRHTPPEGQDDGRD